MRRRPGRRIGRSGAGLALVLLLGLAAPGAAQQQEEMTPPPPVAEFREGDRWQSWGRDASGQTTNSLKIHEKRNGAWAALSGIDDRAGPRDARSFEQLKEPVFYPAAPEENEIFATVDGLLHRYANGRWVDLPIGSTLSDRNGTVYKVDVRVTAYEADQLSQIFGHDAPTALPIGETKSSPVLLPPPDKLAAAADGSAEQPPVEDPPTVPAKEVEPEAPPTPMSLPKAVLYLLLGAGLALILVKLLGRKGGKPGA